MTVLLEKALFVSDFKITLEASGNLKVNWKDPHNSVSIKKKYIFFVAASNADNPKQNECP